MMEKKITAEYLDAVLPSEILNLVSAKDVLRMLHFIALRDVEIERFVLAANRSTRTYFGRLRLAGIVLRVEETNKFFAKLEKKVAKREKRAREKALKKAARKNFFCKVIRKIKNIF